MRLQDELPEALLGEGAHRQAEPSVNMGIRHNVLTLLQMRLDLPLGRYPHQYSFSNLPPSAEAIDIGLGDNRTLALPFVDLIFGCLFALGSFFTLGRFLIIGGFLVHDGILIILRVRGVADDIDN